MILYSFEKNKIGKIILFIFSLLVLFLPLISYGAGTESIFSNQESTYSPGMMIADRAGYGSDRPEDLADAGFIDYLSMFLKFALSFLGIAFFILIIYAGWLWMTAGGNEERLGKAKKILQEAVIGLVIVLAAYAIIYTVMNVIGGPTCAASEDGDWWGDWI